MHVERYCEFHAAAIACLFITIYVCAMRVDGR